MAGARVNCRPHVRHRAVTLIEAVLYISIALALIIGGLVFFQQASFSAKLSQQVRVMSAIMAEARVFYSQQANFNSVSSVAPNALAYSDFLAGEQLDSFLISSGAVPAEIVAASAGVRTGSQLRNVWGGEMAVRGGVDAYTNKVVVQFLMDQIPTSACSRLGPSTATGNASWTDSLGALGMFGNEARPTGNGQSATRSGSGATISSISTICRLNSVSGTVVMGLRANLF